MNEIFNSRIKAMEVLMEKLLENFNWLYKELRKKFISYIRKNANIKKILHLAFRSKRVRIRKKNLKLLKKYLTMEFAGKRGEPKCPNTSQL